MKIIAHRGYWKTKREQNSITAFQRAVDEGYGVETDVCARHGRMIIAHDCDAKKFVSADRVFKIFAQMKSQQVLALNIKCDGLQKKIQTYLKRFKIKNYFIFDASVPDTLLYAKRNIKYFARLSEYEPVTPLIKKASGIWLDAFHRQWYDRALLKRLMRSYKSKICAVSPELHGRTYQRTWQMLKLIQKKEYARQLMVCTDFPQRAQSYFKQ